MATSNQQAGDQCPECSGRISNRFDESVCTSCGLVVAEDKIDHGPEWRSFADEDGDPERAAPGNDTYAGDGMGSQIGYDEDMDARKRTWNRRARTRTKRERNKCYLTGEIRRIVSALDLPDGCGEQGAQLMTTLYAETDGLQGKDLDTVAATGAYVVARVRQQGVSASDVVAVARDVDRKRMLRRRAWLCDTLGLSVPLPDLGQRLTVVATELGLSDATLRDARRLLDGLDDMDRQRGQPSSVVAAILWRVSDRTQAEIGEAAGVCTKTVRDVHQRLPEVGQTTLEQY